MRRRIRPPAFSPNTRRICGVLAVHPRECLAFGEGQALGSRGQRADLATLTFKRIAACSMVALLAAFAIIEHRRPAAQPAEFVAAGDCPMRHTATEAGLHPVMRVAAACQR